MTSNHMLLSRRNLIRAGAALGGLAAASQAIPLFASARSDERAAAPLKPPVPAAPQPVTPEAVPPALMKRALAALERHSDRVALKDRIAIVDFSAQSARKRLHVVDLASGETTSLRVSHGSGSDPGHTGWLQSFSNRPGSNATSDGAYLTSNYYVGNHGSSQRLVGLDPTNDNAMARAIVIHSAWYAEPDMIRQHGQLGRSQGCFAVASAELDPLFAMLGEGRMIYADKV